MKKPLGKGWLAMHIYCFLNTYIKVSLKEKTKKIPLSTENPEFLRKIGFIIAYAFIHYEVFPVKLCKASLKNLFGTVNSSDLFSLFGNYLPNKETSIVQQFRQDTIERWFTLKRVRDMTRTCSQMHRTDKYSEHSSIFWAVWSNGWVFV